MAQAARLNLRMQKELKLLLTDPPHGASFPSLSSSSAASLTSIDALLQGPEGTVYANGVFKIKIQIPERYPFQPPIVTFATPIYHPNIDNGGRICLDILNLPPKGTWQPSLNISTVLTSIGLLLAEPNPDDGLMHEASRDYKYNRQTFDQNARSMTEIHARPGGSESAGGSHDSRTHSFPGTPQAELQPELSSLSSRKLSLGSSSSSDSGKEIDKLPTYGYLKDSSEIRQLKEATGCNKNLDKPQATRHKLSLKVPVVSHGRNGENATTHLPAQCSNLLESKDPPSPLVQVHDNPNKVSHKDEDNTEGSCSEKQSIHSVKTGQRRESREKLDCVPQPTSSQLGSCKSHEALAMSLSTNHQITNLHKDATHKNEICPTNTGPKKVGSIELVGTLGPFGCSGGHLKNEREKPVKTKCSTSQLMKTSGIPCIVSENGGNEIKEKQEVLAAPKLSGISAKPLKPQDQLLGNKNCVNGHCENPTNPDSQFMHVANDARSDQKNQISYDSGEFDSKETTMDSPILEAAIVLDSEDSGDEIVPVRSKLSLARKPLSRKRKI